MRTEIEDKELYDILIKLSHVFKRKFTIKVIGNQLIQYNITVCPYEDRIEYKTLIEIKHNKVIFKNGRIPDYCVIKGWYDKTYETYFIGSRI